MRKKFIVKFDPGEICKSVELNLNLKSLPDPSKKFYRNNVYYRALNYGFSNGFSNDISREILFVITLFFLTNLYSCMYQYY